MSTPLHLPDLDVHRSADDVVERYAAAADALDGNLAFEMEASEAGLNVTRTDSRVVETFRVLPDGYVIRTFVTIADGRARGGVPSCRCRRNGPASCAVATALLPEADEIR